MNINKINCNSVLTKSKLPEVDYCINPYVGCMHACVYCYASFMRRFTGHNQDEWGSFLDVKFNASDILEKEIISRKKRGSILLGSVTDAYQPLESKYKISRKILTILSEHDFPVSILTKSKLVIRDIDVLTKIKDCEVGLTITSLDQQISRIFEPFASSPADRINALATIKKAGIRTYAFIGPILPGITDLEKILSLLRGKVDFVMFESLNINMSNRDKIKGAFVKAGLMRFFSESTDWKKVEGLAREISAKYGIKVKGFYNH